MQFFPFLHSPRPSWTSSSVFSFPAQQSVANVAMSSQTQKKKNMDNHIPGTSGNHIWKPMKPFVHSACVPFSPGVPRKDSATSKPRRAAACSTTMPASRPRKTKAAWGPAPLLAPGTEQGWRAPKLGRKAKVTLKERHPWWNVLEQVSAKHPQHARLG